MEKKDEKRRSAGLKLQPSEYLQLVKGRSPKSRTLLRCVLAFLTGGAICCLGQLAGDIGELYLGISADDRGSFVSVTLIFLAALATGLGVYDRLGRIAGAGSVVPITGFSNSVVSPAMEHRAEGIITGVCAQMFTIAGPVIVCGVTSAAAVGVLTVILDIFR